MLTVSLSFGRSTCYLDTYRLMHKLYLKWTFSQTPSIKLEVPRVIYLLHVVRFCLLISRCLWNWLLRMIHIPALNRRMGKPVRPQKRNRKYAWMNIAQLPTSHIGTRRGYRNTNSFHIHFIILQRIMMRGFPNRVIKCSLMIAKLRSMM